MQLLVAIIIIGLISILVEKYGVDPQVKAKVCIMYAYG